MSLYKSWILTDISAGVWSEDFEISSDRLQQHAPWSIRKRTLHGGLCDGVDVIEVDNGALAYTVLPTRGLGLWQGNYKGHHLGWRAPVQGPVHPKFVNQSDRGGIGWLAGFDEWLCRCGLASNGPPGEDAFTDKAGRTHKTQLTLHGKIANLPAFFVEVRVGLEAPFELSVVGQVEESGLFLGRRLLTTTYTTVPGSNRVVIHDRIENRAAEPAEFQMLYHCNVGAPFLEAGSRVVTPIREMSPLTPRAAEGIDTFDTYAGPVAGFAEQVYCYEPLADSHGRTLAMLYNRAADKGLVVRFNRNELPCFTVWKNTGAIEDGYVTGLEPATNYPNFKTFERQKGRVPVLSPGGHWECKWSLEVQDSTASVAAALAEIVALQAQAKPVLNRSPAARFSSQA